MKKWIGIKKDGEVVCEEGTQWTNDLGNNLVILQLDIDGQIISLPENMEYVQAKTASANIGGSQEVVIESRYIGWKLGNNIVKIRVDEKTNNISLEVD